MTRTLNKNILALGLFVVSLIGNAAEIDLEKLVRDRAAGKGVAKEIEDANNAIKKFFKGDAFILRFDNIRATGGAVRYSEVKAESIPQTIISETFMFRNCTSSDRKDSRSGSITYQEGETITTMDTIRGSASLSITTKELGSANASREVFSSQQQTRNYSKTIVETIQLEETIKPMTALLVKIEKRISNAYLDFEGDMILNADVSKGAGPGWKGETVYLGTYSSLFGEQSFTVRGQIWNAKSHSTNKSYTEIQLDKDNPLHCVQPDLRTKVTAEISALDTKGSMGNLLKFGLTPVHNLSKEKEIGTQHVEPYSSGLRITTSNSIANVEVRARSMGPGFCAVRFSTMGGQTQFLAPPVGWSPWTTLAAHVGVATYTINETILCDTGMIAEIRYFK